MNSKTRGTERPVHRICLHTAVLMVTVALQAGSAQPSSQQSPTGAMSAVQSTALSQGWGYLAQGDLVRAEEIARAALKQDPANPAAVTLAVEVAIARGGWRPALDAYEQWQSGRQLDAAYVVRRIARSALLDAAVTGPAAIRVEATRALSAAGEPNIVEMLKNRPGERTIVDVQTLASLGDAEAVDTVATALREGTGDRMSAIRALAASGSTRAIEPLMQALDHQRPELRAAAAKGLGELNARAAIPQLQALLKDPIPITQMSAAAGLVRLQDPSGAAVLQRWLASDVSGVRLEAASGLASNPDATWMAAVRALLGDADPGIQISAARLLAPYDQVAATAALDRLAKDPNLAIREEAQRVVPSVIGNDIGRLRRFLRDGDPLIRVRAAAQILNLTR